MPNAWTYWSKGRGRTPDPRAGESFGNRSRSPGRPGGRERRPSYDQPGREYDTPPGRYGDDEIPGRDPGGEPLPRVPQLPGYIEPFNPRDPSEGSPFGAPGLSDFFLPFAMAAMAARFSREVFDARFRPHGPTEVYKQGLMVGMQITGSCSNTDTGAQCGRGMFYLTSVGVACNFLTSFPCGVGLPNTYNDIFWGKSLFMQSNGRFFTDIRGNFAPGTVFPTKFGWWVPFGHQYPTPMVPPQFDPMAQPINRPAPPPVPVPPALAPFRPVRPEGSSRHPGEPGAPPRGGRQSPRPPRYRPRPPRKREKEKKYYTNGMRAANLILDWVTESLDALEALWRAIPGNADKGSPSHKKMVSDLWKNWDRIPVGDAILQLALEHAEDKAWGAFHRATQGPPGFGTDSPVQKAKRGAGIVLRDYL